MIKNAALYFLLSTFFSVEVPSESKTTCQFVIDELNHYGLDEEPLNFAFSMIADYRETTCSFDIQKVPDHQLIIQMINYENAIFRAIAYYGTDHFMLIDRNRQGKEIQKNKDIISEVRNLEQYVCSEITLNPLSADILHGYHVYLTLKANGQICRRKVYTDFEYENLKLGSSSRAFLESLHGLILYEADVVNN